MAKICKGETKTPVNETMILAVCRVFFYQFFPAGALTIFKLIVFRPVPVARRKLKRHVISYIAMAMAS